MTIVQLWLPRSPMLITLAVRLAVLKLNHLLLGLNAASAAWISDADHMWGRPAAMRESVLLAAPSLWSLSLLILISHTYYSEVRFLHYSYAVRSFQIEGKQSPAQMWLMCIMQNNTKSITSSGVTDISYASILLLEAAWSNSLMRT